MRLSRAAHEGIFSIPHHGENQQGKGTMGGHHRLLFLPGQAGVSTPQPLLCPPGLVPEPTGQVAETGTLWENPGGEKPHSCPQHPTTPIGNPQCPAFASATSCVVVPPCKAPGPHGRTGKMQHHILLGQEEAASWPCHLPWKCAPPGRCWVPPHARKPLLQGW